MITKTGKVALFGRMTYNGSSTSKNAGVPFKSTNGTTYYLDVKTNIAILNTNIVSTAIKFGSGTTPATEDDYNLETEISGITGTSTETIKNDNGSIKREFLLTLTNGNDSSVTINEIGLFSSMNGYTSATSTSSPSSKDIMIERTVFETPVVIEAGGNAVIKYSITAGWPSEE